ncbi:MAG: OmpA family protein [Polyangiaceae bacterium]|jgi:OOP family OmpA-OmpF porin|nr:OmpA family protein [Polyangiaceae bacterium]
MVLSRGFRHGLFGRWFAATVAGACALGAASEAHAQDTTFSLDRLRIGGAPDDGIGVWRPEMADEPRIYGQLALGLSWNPFRIEHHIEDENQRQAVAAVSGAPVRQQLTAYMGLGFEVWKRLGVNVMFPLTLVQTGNPTNVAGVPAASDAVDVAPVAPGDMRFEARGVIVRTTNGFFKLGANAAIWAPSGNDKSFTGDKGVSGDLGLATELDWKDFILTFDTGFHLRPESGVNDFVVGHEWNYGVAGFLPFRDDMIRLGLSVFGSVQMTGDDAAKVETSPIEWMAEARFALEKKKQLWLNGFGGSRMTPGYAPDFRTGIAFGGWVNLIDKEPPSPKKEKKFDTFNDKLDTDKDGYPDHMDLCPTEPEDGKPPFPTDGCPAESDRDGDGIPDYRDKCPDEKEDFDGVDDKDGCPEDDADKDGIGDAKDDCPKEPGEPSTEKGKNGCPKFIRRIEGSTEIQVLKKVEFEFGKATLRPDSFPILDEVYKLLVANPEIKLLSIEGHTDNVGSDQGNLLLSKNRAKSCLDYLIKKGVASSRLSSEGFGEGKPIETNDTAEGRAKNRRTEFHIRDQAIPGVESGTSPTGPVPGQ